MIDLVLSRPAARDGQQAKHTLPMEIVNRYLDDASGRIQGQLALHADWQDPPGYLGDTLRRIAVGGVQVKACFYANASVRWMQKCLEAGCRVSIGANVLKGDALKEMAAIFKRDALAESEGVEIFAPLPAPDSKLPFLEPVLEAGLPVQSVVLAPNWQDYFSGPRPIDETAYDPWSDVLEQSVNTLTLAGIQARLACGLPLCLFPAHQLGRLARRRLRFPLGHCTPDLMVTPDGVVHACQRLDLPDTLSKSDRSPAETTEAIQRWLKPYRSLCPRADQLVCRSAVCGACGCGCLSESMAAWNKS